MRPCPTLGVPRRMTITDWDGPLPEAGDYMRSAGGTLYLVSLLKPTRPGSKALARATVLKFPRGTSLSEDVVCHAFAWNGRSRRGRA